MFGVHARAYGPMGHGLSDTLPPWYSGPRDTLEDRLRMFYSYWNPSKQDRASDLVRKFRSSEDKVNDALYSKYLVDLRSSEKVHLLPPIAHACRLLWRTQCHCGRILTRKDLTGVCVTNCCKVCPISRRGTNSCALRMYQTNALLLRPFAMEKDVRMTSLNGRALAPGCRDVGLGVWMVVDVFVHRISFEKHTWQPNYMLYLTLFFRSHCMTKPSRR